MKQRGRKRREKKMIGGGKDINMERREGRRGKVVEVYWWGRR